MSDQLWSHFHPAVAEWFHSVFTSATTPQRRGWPAIARGESTLILAPTGSGKTLAAFLWSLNRLMFEPVPEPMRRCRVLYVSPLKALAVDVERNLRAPLAGISNVAGSHDLPFHAPAIAVRTGDTPASDRAKFQRAPSDILITTPESLFLLLTSNARESLRAVETVIIDEIHALVSTKRGAHIALSLERLEKLVEAPLQRIGLSATQRPLEEVARFLGGAAAKPSATTSASAAEGRYGETSPKPARKPAGAGGKITKPTTKKQTHKADFADSVHDEFEVERAVTFRPVTIVDASAPKQLAITVQTPVEDMAEMGKPLAQPSGPASQGPVAQSIWSSIYPKLLELIRSHTSTLLFVNSRRLAERLAGAINELAGEPLVRAHHGSLARAQRTEIEDLLKGGHLRALVATSSLELGIDMGAIDLVIQIEAPPSVASGLQRIGRAGHRIDAVSEGIIFPKFRGDLVACAAVTAAMRQGKVESSRYPRNPLDVMAQQLVAMTAMERWSVDDLYRTVRSAAPYAELGRPIFDGVLDMLSGRYPSDEFAELRPRITWDRVNGMAVARQGAKRVAIANAGTIPDRGLYGVFLSGAEKDKARVGELDEEMVFEARAGETFLLGASTWHIDQITHDRVLVTPAPGQPGKMPFWKGEGPGRPIELGMAIGKLVRELRQAPRAQALGRLRTDHGLDALASENLLAYLDDQHAATGAVPDDRTIVIEQSRDDIGDWRVAVLSPLGSRVHAPWAMAATARIRDEQGLDVEAMWSDEGFVIRYPDGESAPNTALLIPDPDQVERLVVRQLGSTAMFSARFREAAGRALLLPRRRPGARAPLWQLRKRASDLLAVAARFGSFPIILEAYRECLRDIFDLPALVGILSRMRSRSIRVVNVESRTPSPFSASLLFGYVANYIYDGDAPLAERRAQALSVDQSQLRDLIGDTELRDLLDEAALETLEAELQYLPERFHARSADAVHDLLLRLGDLSREEIEARSVASVADAAVTELVPARRLLEVRIAGQPRLIAIEDAARYRDAVGTPLPQGLPDTLLEPVEDPVGDLVRRYARTHGPFSSGEVSTRLGLGIAIVEATLGRLRAAGRVVEGEFRPGGRGREWCDADVLRNVRQRSLAKLRREVEPVDASALGRFLVTWHGFSRPRTGLDGLLDVIEQLQGVPIVASVLEREVLAARLRNYSPDMLDTLLGAGEVTWAGVEALGDRDGRIALYLTDHVSRLRPPDSLSPGRTQGLAGRDAQLIAWLHRHGASFFAPLHEAAGGGFPRETVDAIWDLVWKGLLTNDTLHALRAYTAPPERARRTPHAASFRSRRLIPPSAEGRWAAVGAAGGDQTKWAAAMAQQLLTRHGVVTRDVTAVEHLPGGFSALYPVLRRLEETGRIRRGYFVAGLGAAQFAQSGAVDLLRDSRESRDEEITVTISAADPANPYGVLIPWPLQMTPTSTSKGHDLKPRGATRSAGARVVLVNGRLVCWIGRGDRLLIVSLPDDEPDRSRAGRAMARELVALAPRAPEGRRGWLIEEINGLAAAADPTGQFLIDAGFTATSLGLQLRVPKGPKPSSPQALKP
ncbi:MAG: DEAD/DEAH box helicase [Acidobacteria bacterium RIFCSPLOWO2_12_FULL_67_14b]|nr:MAG: DEAD/DEAH box helicase [Acidobacteria bacterium RIFCSPLOWO2_12_FULL_67_14b]